MKTRRILLRLLWAVLAVLPFGVVALSLATDARVGNGDLSPIGGGLFTIGALAAVVNAYLSWLRTPLLVLAGRNPNKIRWISGAPLLGDLAPIGLLLMDPCVPLGLVTLGLLVVDSGGITWFVIAVWSDTTFWNP